MANNMVCKKREKSSLVVSAPDALDMIVRFFSAGHLTCSALRMEKVVFV